MTEVDDVKAKINKLFQDAGDRQEDVLKRLSGENDDKLVVDALETQVQDILKTAKEKNFKIYSRPPTKKDDKSKTGGAESDIEVTNKDKVKDAADKLDKEIPDFFGDTGSKSFDNILSTLSDKIYTLVDYILPYKEAIMKFLEPYASAISTRLSSMIDSWTRGAEKDAVGDLKTDAKGVVENVLDTIKEAPLEG